MVEGRVVFVTGHFDIFKLIEKMIVIYLLNCTINYNKYILLKLICCWVSLSGKFIILIYKKHSKIINLSLYKKLL